MSDKRPKLERFLLGPGEARYPYIDKPDNKFPPENPKPVYKCELILEDDERTRAVIDKMVRIRDAKHSETRKVLKKRIAAAKPAEQKKLQKKLDNITAVDVFEPHFDDAGEETGKVIIKTKMNAEVTPRDGKPYKQSPNIFDSVKQPLHGVAIWGGSTLKIAGDIVPYFMESTGNVGISLRMKGVQVIKLVTAGHADAASYGFDDEEGGFTGSDAADSFDDDVSASDSVDEDDDF